MVFSQLCYPLNCWYIVPGSTWELSQEKRLVALSTMVKRWVWPPLEAGRGPTRSIWTWERVATFGLLQPEAVSSSEPLLCFCQGVVGREERHLALWLTVGRLSVLPADGSQATDLCFKNGCQTRGRPGRQAARQTARPTSQSTSLD